MITVAEPSSPLLMPDIPPENSPLVNAHRFASQSSMRPRLLALAVLAAALAGCGTRPYVDCQVDSRTDGSPHSAGTIAVVSETPAGMDALEHAEYRTMLLRAFKSKGWRPVETGGKPDALVRFAYGIDEGKVVGSVSSGYTSAQYYGGGVAGATSAGSSSSVIVYKRILAVTASKPDGSPAWSVIVKSKGGSDNLRDTFPYLAKAASDWFGRSNTGTRRAVIQRGDADFIISDTPLPPPPGPWEKPE